MTDYTTIVEEHGRKKARIDVGRFAADLAIELGAEVMATAEGWRELKIAEDLSLMLCVAYDKIYVYVKSRALGIPRGDELYYSQSQAAAMPEARVSPSRPMAAIAKDIRRRVIEPSAAPLAYRKNYAAQRQAARDNLERWLAAFAITCPEMHQDSRRSDNSPYQRLIFWEGGGGGLHMHATVHSDGRISIPLMPDLSAPEFTELCSILRRRVNGEKNV